MIGWTINVAHNLRFGAWRFAESLLWLPNAKMTKEAVDQLT
jgi:hypothetical protein